MPAIEVGGHRLEFEWVGPPRARGSPAVFLHEGLGCAAMWRGFAEELAAKTGRPALLYSRWGHGGSERLDGQRTPRFMHEEALRTLPELLERLRVSSPVLVGHSDGASIALIYAASGLGPVEALVLEAPHVLVEQVTVDSIARVRSEFERTDLKERLARHHGDNTETMFYGWSDVWLSPEFRDWNIEECLPRIGCPVFAVQGEQDEYGTVGQIARIAAGAAGRVETLFLAACGHQPHRDRHDDVLDAMARFLETRA